MKQALIHLYLSLKAKAHCFTSDPEQLSLLNLNPLTLLDYISSYIDIAINAQVEERMESMKTLKSEEYSQDLEQVTQNLEAEVRSHIRVLFTEISR